MDALFNQVKGFQPVSTQNNNNIDNDKLLFLQQQQQQQQQPTLLQQQMMLASQPFNNNNFNLNNIGNFGLKQQEQMLLLLQQQQLQQQMAQKQSQLSQMSMFLSMCPNFDENANYPQEILKVVITNEYLYNQIQDLLSDRKTLQQRISNLEAKIEEHQGENSQYSQESQKKKNRRTAQEIQKSFICPYENCSKAYGSDVSLNLHIKIKHNGGSKTEREKLAKAILLAKMNKDEIPKLNIDFPPGYLDNFEEYIKQDLEQQQNEEGQVDQTSSKQLEQSLLKTENKNIETQQQTESLDQMVENKKDEELQLQQLQQQEKKECQQNQQQEGEKQKILLEKNKSQQLIHSTSKDINNDSSTVDDSSQFMQDQATQKKIKIISENMEKTVPSKKENQQQQHQTQLQQQLFETVSKKLEL